MNTAERLALGAFRIARRRRDDDAAVAMAHQMAAGAFYAAAVADPDPLGPVTSMLRDDLWRLLYQEGYRAEVIGPFLTDALDSAVERLLEHDRRAL